MRVAGGECREIERRSEFIRMYIVRVDKLFEHESSDGESQEESVGRSRGAVKARRFRVLHVC